MNYMDSCLGVSAQSTGAVGLARFNLRTRYRYAEDFRLHPLRKGLQ